MSRFKFRAYHTERKEWCFGYEKLGGFSLFGEVTIGGGFDLPILELKYLDIMQSTGLKDKNGVEIYEGDIVASYYGAPIRTVIAPVVFEESCFLVKTPNHNPKKCIFAEFISAMHETEVIGNIHENPELMECKQ